MATVQRMITESVAKALQVVLAPAPAAAAGGVSSAGGGVSPAGGCVVRHAGADGEPHHAPAARVEGLQEEAMANAPPAASQAVEPEGKGKGKGRGQGQGKGKHKGKSDREGAWIPLAKRVRQEAGGGQHAHVAAVLESVAEMLRASA